MRVLKTQRVPMLTYRKEVWQDNVVELIVYVKVSLNNAV